MNVSKTIIWEAAERTGMMFYVINPNTSTFQHEEQVPDYIVNAYPLFLSMIIIEFIITYINGTGQYRFNESFSSSAHGILQQCAKILTGSIELIGYQWLYERRIIDLDWSSYWTWCWAAIGADFVYYWFHRAAHEISLFWAAHQVHHSSEDYTLITALRQSIFQRYFSIGFYQPLGLLGIPLPALLVHNQFNLLYQFWIHTELVSSLGPLELIFNTASHHRVHHGMNKWCLDKNYAGLLIIWDRMFGTFQAEDLSHPITYGLVDQPNKMNVLRNQLFYFRDIFKKSQSMKSFKDKMKALFYGPGWMPGTERLGDLSTLPDNPPARVKYDPYLPKWVEIYLLIHFVIVVLVQHCFAVNYQSLSWSTVLMCLAFIFTSLGNIGALYDGSRLAPMLEVLRCAVWGTYFSYSSIMDSLVRGCITAYLAGSAIIWTGICYRNSNKIDKSN